MSKDLLTLKDDEDARQAFDFLHDAMAIQSIVRDVLIA